MYERSAIVLERVFNAILHFDKRINLKTIYKDYKNVLEKTEKYQQILAEEDKVINEFDKTASEIRNIQHEQKKLSKDNTNLEVERNDLFEDLDEDSGKVEKEMTKIENKIANNNERLVELRKSYIDLITIFDKKQKQRNVCSKTRRAEEKQYLELINEASKNLESISKEDVLELKKFMTSEENQNQEVINLMLDNGKDERVPFNKEVIENSVNFRNEIAKKEAECYLNIYEKLKSLAAELNDDINVSLEKYKKQLRNNSCRLAFYKAEKLYIVSFLDNERMTAVNGVKAHNKIMKETCLDFESDVEQFKNLEQLIMLEISSKATKKAYIELYNKEYLENIENKEKDFEEELNNIKINSGAIINSDYWRIEEIKNIYKIFQKEMTEKFGRSFVEDKEQKLERKAENSIDIDYDKNIKENDNLESKTSGYLKDKDTDNLNKDLEDEEDEEDDIFKAEIPDDDVEYVEELEFDDDISDDDNDSEDNDIFENQ